MGEIRGNRTDRTHTDDAGSDQPAVLQVDFFVFGVISSEDNIFREICLMAMPTKLVTLRQYLLKTGRPEEEYNFKQNRRCSNGHDF